MKDPDPSAVHSIPLPEVEPAGAFRHPLHEYAVNQDHAATSESRLRRSDSVSPASLPRPVVTVKHRRILLAVAAESVIYALTPIIRALDAAVVKVEDGAALERALQERGTFDLVLTDARLKGGSGLGILAGMRRSGSQTPFVIVQSIHQHLIRVAVGGGSGGVLSTRVVNELALVEIAEGLLGLHDVPASSRRTPRFA